MNKRSLRKLRLFTIVVLAVVAVFAVICLYDRIIEPQTQTKKAAELIARFQLREHIVKPGETWYKYAEKITPPEIDVRAVVYELKIRNEKAGFQHDTSLMSGEPVVIPVFPIK